MDISCASHRIWERDNLVGDADDALQRKALPDALLTMRERCIHCVALSRPESNGATKINAAIPRTAALTKSE
jgi:hypothetical protein